MSNGQQPLVVATNNAYEYALAGPADAQVDAESNNDESPVPQQGPSTDVEHVKNAQASSSTWEDFFDFSEYALDGAADAHNDRLNNDELPAPLQGPSTDVEHVENAQASFQTLENFTAPVADLPRWPQFDGNLYHLPQHSANAQLPTQDDALPQHEHEAGNAMDGPPGGYRAQPSTALQGAARSQHGYNPGYHVNGPPGAYYLQPSTAAAPQGYAWPQLGYHPAPFYPDQPPQTVAGPSYPNQPPQAIAGPSYPNQPPQAVAGPSYPHRHPQVTGPFYPYQHPHTVMGPPIMNNPTGAFPQNQDAPLQMGAGGGSTVQPASSASTSRRKRKAHQMVASSDGNSTSSIPLKPKKKKPRRHDDIGSGKFGPYALLDASATVMPMPVHDPQPFDVSFRRTLDPDGKPLQTRRYGVIELDNSLPRGSDNVTEHHSSGPICVRMCDWDDDQPCGLFIETERTRIEDHLWYWHGVKLKDKTACRIKDCTEVKPMQYLGRHIETVHFKTGSRCFYCNKLCARGDSLKRHLNGCQVLSDSRERAMQAGHDFYCKEGIKSVYGYIVPAKNAT